MSEIPNIDIDGLHSLFESYDLTKHSAQGNEFIIAVANKNISELSIQPLYRNLIGGAEEAYIWRKELAKKLCDPQAGYGADGLIFLDYVSLAFSVTEGSGLSEDSSAVAPEEISGAKMQLYNSDGSDAEISGNGLRCLGQAVARKWGIYDFRVELAPFKLAVDSDSAIRSVIVRKENSEYNAEPQAHQRTDEKIDEISGSQNLYDWVEVEMGEGSVEFLPGLRKTLGEIRKNWNVQGAWHVSVGNPHLVLQVREGSLENIDIARDGKIAAELAKNNELGDLNVEFIDEIKNAEIINAENASNKNIDELSYINLKVYERGAGATKACGSGAVASAGVAALAALQKSGEAGRREEIRVKMEGGDVTVFTRDMDLPGWASESQNVKISEYLDNTHTGRVKTKTVRIPFDDKKIYWLSGEVEFQGRISPN